VAVLPIRTFGDPVLRQRGREVDKLRRVHRKLIADMFETMRAAPGVGLAGPQVGVLERIFVWEVDEESGVIVNPVITALSDERVEDDEGCLSIPGIVYQVERASKVTVTGLDERGRSLVLEAEGLLARVVQHEIDHLDGVLFLDRRPQELRREALRQLSGLSPAPTGAAARPEEAL
jgi:peptide deformylase